MSASAWDRAVDLAARAVVLAQSNGCCDQWPKPCANCDCFRDQRPDVMAGYERAHAHAALAAALPVLLEELAQRIAGVVPYGFELNYDGTEERERAAYLEGVHDAYDLVQGFAAEVTQ